MSVTTLTSACGVIALLDETSPALKEHALQSLNVLVDVFWAEIASSIHKIEELSENVNFAQRALASAVASKVFYHLEQLDEALKYALIAGNLFDISKQSEYTETLIAKSIDEYTRIRLSGNAISSAPKASALVMDPRLENIVEKMFQRCFDDEQLHQAIGIALESHRLDMMRASISKAKNDAQKIVLIKYCLNLALTVIQNRDFRQKVLREICTLYFSLTTPDHLSVCQCLLYLDDATGVANALHDLLKAGDNHVLTAYQVAYDLAENENYPFQLRTINALPSNKPDSNDPFEQSLTNLKYILSGESAISLYTQFLYSQAQTDLNIIANIKEKVEGRNSVTHSAAIICHAMMQCGTTRDNFIRDNLDWLSRATNWAKMSVTAAFGVIHKGHIKQSMRILQPYLPQDIPDAGHGAQSSPYLVSGALYGLGLIHANRGGDQRAYLENALNNAADSEVIQHGACLGIGLNSMATNDESLFEVLKGILFHDNAVAGEAAGLAMGLVELGSARSSAIEEMVAYAHDTQHEKIIRGLGLGVALIMSGREEQADNLIDSLLKDKDANLRYGGCFTIALAFASTANNSAVKRLLHVAVSDVSTDVRRAAVISLGFVLCNVPERVPKIVSLLSESYNPHVRYGAALAIGIACASTGLKAAVDLLSTLSKDRVDFVRQGGMIGLSMVLMQVNAVQDPAVDVHRTLLTTMIEGKHADTQTKLGAILAQGIIDAGGRNMTIALRSAAGHKRMGAIVGMVLFTQYWYWYPLLHTLSLAFTPTSLIALNSSLKMPKNVSFVSNAKPSLFAYPPVQLPKKEEEVKKVPTAQLSISAKAKARALHKKQGSTCTSADHPMEIDSPAKETDKAADPVTPPEPEFAVLGNPSRVTPSQRSYVTIAKSQRYMPLKKDLSGIIVCIDSQPDLPEELIVSDQPKALGVGEQEEPSPPAPFEFTR